MTRQFLANFIMSDQVSMAAVEQALLRSEGMWQPDVTRHVRAALGLRPSAKHGLIVGPEKSSRLPTTALMSLVNESRARRNLRLIAPFKRQRNK